MTPVQILIQTLAAFIGTVAFALLFGVPRKYFVMCGLIAALGWLLYCILAKVGLSPTECTFFAAMLAVFCSRFAAVFLRCPVTVFITCGIFPLIPGAGIYWTAYHFVMNETALAAESGFGAVKAVIAIVLGIVIVQMLPKQLFKLAQVKQKNR